MGKKTISGWNKTKQKLLNEITQKTGKSQSQIVREALAFYQLFLAFEDNYHMMVRLRQSLPAKKIIGRPKKGSIS